jgi:Fe2+ transport system protein FeoA
MGLRPNVQVEVKERAPFNGPMQIQVEGGDQYSLGLEVANHIYVSL